MMKPLLEMSAACVMLVRPESGTEFQMHKYYGFSRRESLSFTNVLRSSGELRPPVADHAQPKISIKFGLKSQKSSIRCL